MIITIDGPVGTGKSTVAKRLADSLGYIFFDTGAMYRTLTYALIKHGIDIKNPEALDTFLKTFTFSVRVHHGEKHHYLDHQDVTKEIRSPEVTARVSEVSSLPVVREKLVAMQRQLSKGVNAVFEGRDMGTVVFPEATIKIFLTGDLAVRARRRYEEMIAKNPREVATLTLEKVMADVEQRDTYDSTREMSPLKPAPDALHIDTTSLTPDEVVMQILEYRDALKMRIEEMKNGGTK